MFIDDSHESSLRVTFSKDISLQLGFQSAERDIMTVLAYFSMQLKSFWTQQTELIRDPTVRTKPQDKDDFMYQN